MTNQGFYDLEFIVTFVAIIVVGTWICKQAIEFISFIAFKTKVKRKIKKDLKIRGTINVYKLR